MSRSGQGRHQECGGDGAAKLTGPDATARR